MLLPGGHQVLGNDVNVSEIFREADLDQELPKGSAGHVAVGFVF